MLARPATLPALLSICFPACSEGGMVSAPVVRVDLRPKLPVPVQRRLAVADTSFECRRVFKLAAAGAEQAFVASWRVLDEGSARYIIAVEVNPDGPTRGAGAPAASALVEESEHPRAGAQRLATAPVRVTWSASKGCSKVSASARLVLGADDPGCERPKGPGKLLTPVP